jgi:hypothetical protein
MENAENAQIILHSFEKIPHLRSIIYIVINKRKYACIHIHWVLIPFECAPNVMIDRFTDEH